ncbi:MAG: hypothetical protein HYS98_00295 [Deltaproteobacteria bacterium]|nr:hypothetical protein [Deltaproteobacteria bacterium]
MRNMDSSAQPEMASPLNDRGDRLPRLLAMTIACLILTSCGMPGMPDINFWSPGDSQEKATSQNLTSNQGMTTNPTSNTIGHHFGTSQNTNTGTILTTPTSTPPNLTRPANFNLLCPAGTTNLAQETNIHLGMTYPVFTDLNPTSYASTFRGTIGSCPTPPNYIGGMTATDPNLSCNFNNPWKISWNRAVTITEIRILVTPLSASSGANSQNFVNGAIIELNLYYGSYIDTYQNPGTITGQMINFFPAAATNLTSFLLEFEKVLKLQNNTNDPNDVGIGISEIVICGN